MYTKQNKNIWDKLKPPPYTQTMVCTIRSNSKMEMWREMSYCSAILVHAHT